MKLNLNLHVHSHFKKHFLVFMCLIAFGVTNAQSKTIQGKVTSDGLPLVGAKKK